MRHTDPRTDAYIQNAPEYARNILKHLRNLIHEACPDVCETLKWQFPHFEYKGRILCSFAAFKQHCAFTFRRAVDLPDPKGLLQTGERSAMGHLGRIESMQNLPGDKDMLQLLRHVMTLNETDAAAVKRTAIRKTVSAMPVPDDLNAAILHTAGAREAFLRMSTAKQNAYIRWIEAAGTTETRLNRANSAALWISEGKALNWQYKKR